MPVSLEFIDLIFLLFLRGGVIFEVKKDFIELVIVNFVQFILV